ncbi:MAG: hypothetical protein P8J74_00305 [Woeseiaceae bacterium]|jgi:hypothetical protein|nr:hypothetical protein [Woeseiaceae bacterium]
MKIEYFENGLALLAALIILIGVSAAAEIALNGDLGTIKTYNAAQR